MTQTGPHEVLVYAPLANDAEAIGGALKDFDIPLCICRDEGEFRNGLAAKPLCAVISHEVAGQATADMLEAELAEEPSWSTLPLIFLVADVSRLPPACRAMIERNPPANAIVVQRPAKPVVLRSVIRTQIRLRQRQFETDRLMQELGEAERYSRFLLSELRHRVGNMLAVTESMVRMTARQHDDVDAFRDTIAMRLGAMARASQLLSNDGYGQTPLVEIIRQHVEPYCQSEDQLSLDGPEISLDGRKAFNFALIVHEMATNAAKYGALGRADGHLNVGWDASGDGFNLAWKEISGATISPPSSKSFGSIAIEQMARQLGAESRMDFEKDGLRWRFSLRDP